MREQALRGLCYNVTAMSPRIFRFGLFVLGAALCGAVMAGRARPAQSTGDARPASTGAHSEILLVFPFENESRMANLDWLGEGLSELTAERLEDRGVNVLSREDRLATLERMGLPDSARFSHATLIKIAGEADADAVVYGRFQSDGKTATLEARVLRLSAAVSFAAAHGDGQHAGSAPRACALDVEDYCARSIRNNARSKAQAGTNRVSPIRRRRCVLDALENFVRGLTGSEDEERLRLLREAARLEPAWDRPAFELGQIYFKRRDCDSALVWYSRVPPNRPDGPEASFATGVCHLARNDAGARGCRVFRIARTHAQTRRKRFASGIAGNAQ